jgi:hypothetical protein
LTKETSDSVCQASSDEGSPQSVREEGEDSGSEEQVDSGSEEQVDSEIEEQDDNGSKDSDLNSPPPKRRKEVIFGSDEGIIGKTLDLRECSQCLNLVCIIKIFHLLCVRCLPDAFKYEPSQQLTVQSYASTVNMEYNLNFKIFYG